MDFRFWWGFNFDEKSIYCLNVPKFFTKYHIAQNFPDSNNALYFQQDNTLDTYLESIWPWTALTEDELTLSLRLRAQTTWIEALCFLSNSHSPHLCTCFVRRQKSWKNNSFFSKISTVWTFGVFLNLSQQKSPIAEIIGIYFLGTIIPRKHMPEISAIFWALLLW